MSKKPGHEEQEDGQLVTSATVHFRERWSWAWHRVDASDFFQSVGAAVLAGVLVVIAAPQDPVAVATMAAIGGASLMFGANLLWNLYHHARPEILADRLTATGEKVAQLDSRKDRQSAINDLARKYEEGVAIKNDRAVSAVAWSQQNQGWHDATEKLLDSRFSSAETSLFRASEARMPPGGRQDVARDLAVLNGQLETLKRMIGTGKAK